MISLAAHNVLDYVIGAVLILCPYIFGFSDLRSPMDVFQVLGFGLIGYSLLTNYRYSIVKAIPLPVHMALDVLAGVVLIAAPYVFGYRAFLTGGQTVLHFVMGLAAILLVAVTKTRTGKVSQITSTEEDSTRRAA